MAEICVIGAGPAGSTYAARMAQLGHDVIVVEAARFPRRHLGESLSPGVLPLLEVTGARSSILGADFLRVRNIYVHWEGEPQVHEDPREQGLLADRGEFDCLLLDRARDLGVRVRQPARVLRRQRERDRWSVEIQADGALEQLHVDFVADASGRAAMSRQTRVRTGCRTVALYAYWRGAGLPRAPRIEAGKAAWTWGVPLSGGSYNTLVFIDVHHFRSAPRATLEERFLEFLAKSGLATGLVNARLDGAVRAVDATPWLDPEGVTPHSIRVGEAALSIDPVSSSGVQKAIQSALAAAIVSNTLLRKPALADAAMRFYRSSLLEGSSRHSRWAAEYYRKVAEQRGGRFWEDRAAGAKPDPAPRRIAVDDRMLVATPVALSPQTQLVTTPCLDGDFVALQPALCHPNLEAPVTWLGRHAVAPLLQRLETPATALQLAISWSSHIPLSSGLAIASWLLSHRILVEEAGGK